MKVTKSIGISLLIAFLVLMNMDSAWAKKQEAVFSYTGAQQSFVVPLGVTEVHIQAYGAQGGIGQQISGNTVTGEGPGGLGGYAEGNLAVTPGETLEIFVGGQGGSSSGLLEGGGFNGGGDANSSGPDNTRGGGGGASDVRVGGTTFNDRVIVAAGGGGGCGTDVFPGGEGGGLNGGDGGGFELGTGATQFAGGIGFVGADVGVCNDGQFGIGGSSGPTTETCAGAGGGWYGGGSGCGAGGGSSYIGGVESGTTVPGVREGDGMVVINYVDSENIPTLSEWGLIAMAGILGIAGFLAVRRRAFAV